MNTNLIIDMQNATVAYNGNAALSTVSLQVTTGECVAIMGANGAGKTTLLTAINGFTPLTSGIVQVLGTAPTGGNATRLRRRIGYVAQTQPLDPRMPITLYESVMTGVYGRLGWRNKPAAHDHDLVSSTLDRLHILQLAKRPLGHLSGGELRRTMIARCLVQQPEIMLLDEPTASLDEESCAIIMQIMDALHQEQKMTMLWVTHDRDALPQSCTRMIRMHNGRVAQDGPFTPTASREKCHNV